MCTKKFYQSVTRQDIRTIPAGGILYFNALITGVFAFPTNIANKAIITKVSIDINSTIGLGFISMRGLFLNNLITGASNRLNVNPPSVATNWGTLAQQNQQFILANSYNDWCGSIKSSGIDIQSTFAKIEGNAGDTALVFITMNVEYEMEESL
jgi:hypothetical protein